MDLGTLVGSIFVWGLLLYSMALGVGIAVYIDMPSVYIVMGGSLAALMIAFDMGEMKKFGKLFAYSFKPPKFDLNALIKKIVEYSMQARRDGILSLEGPASQEQNKFLQKGIMMAVDGTEPDVVKELMELEMSQMEARHKNTVAIFDKWGGLAGAYGLIGTLIGLVAMLFNMSDPSAIGPSMAVALLTTLYGAMIANMITDPMSNKLNFRTAEEMTAMTICIEGVVSIQAGDNPRVLEQKLLVFVPPNKRVSQFE